MKLSPLSLILAPLALAAGLPRLSTWTHPAAAERTPFVVPSLQHWEAGEGTWALSPGARIVVDAAYADATGQTLMADPATLREYAGAFADDLGALGHVPAVVVGTPGRGDIFLTICADKEEGYVLEIAETGVVVRGGSARGAFWGTRTVLQLLLQGPLPGGVARDWPNYPERKFFQDIARKAIPMGDLEEYARLASFFKINTLHHHYSDNPAVRSKALMPDWAEQYAGFRLRGEGYPWSMYASNDTSYSRSEMRAFQDFIKPRGLDLIPEIDTPAHSLWATKFHPEWSIQNASARGDWLDLENPQVWEFVERVWDEFLPFFDAREVSVGADEYSPDKGELVRRYVNHLHDYLGKHNRSIRMWGSDVRLPGATAINPAIHTDHWDWTYSNPLDLVARGHRVCNLNAPDVYLVPRTAAYWDYINTKNIYERWEPWVFDMFDRGNASRNLAPREPLLTGGGFANWNDFMGESVTRVELYDRVSRAMGVFAEKLWSGGKNAENVKFEDWEPRMKKLLRSIPGVTLTRRPPTKGQFVLSYDFEDGAKDASENGYDGTLEGVDIVDGGGGHGKVAQLTPGTYISTPVDGIAYPYAVGLWVKPAANQTAEAVLLESSDSRVLISNATAPTVTFEQDGFQYATNVILPPEKWSHLAFVADGHATYVFFNMRRISTINWFNPRWDSLRNETMVLTAPLASIGSRTRTSATALVDGVFALDRDSCAGEIAFLANHYAGALP